MSGVNSTILILAPHLIYPARNGSDISLDRIAKHLSEKVSTVDILGSKVWKRYEAGVCVESTTYENQMRRKNIAGLRTILYSSHFYLEKFITPRYIRKAKELIQAKSYEVVLHSYITTSTIAFAQFQEYKAQHLVWTHNDEFKWFRDLRVNAKNLLERYVAYSSEKWLHAFFKKHQNTFTFLHVTEADHAGFAAYYPDHQATVIPIGVSMPSETAPPLVPPLTEVRLVFVGTLGVKMNYDALLHFEKCFYPTIQSKLGKALTIQVVGSTPSHAVRTLCEKNAWQLKPDVSDEEMDEILLGATFTLLPFSYATGAKLKLLKSLSYGIPYLGTTFVKAQGHDAPYPCLLSDDPEAWVQHISKIQQDGIKENLRQHLVSIAKQHSWQASAGKLLDIILRNRPLRND